MTETRPLARLPVRRPSVRSPGGGHDVAGRPWGWSLPGVRRRLPSGHDVAAAPRRSSRRRPPGRWRVVLWRARVPFAAVMLGSSVALALAELRPAPPPRVPVVVAAHHVPAGAPLAPADLAVGHLPPGAVADGAHRDPADLVGRAPVVALPARLPVVDGLLVDDRLGSAGPPGTVVVPVRLADPGVAGLLRPGDRVDLFAATTSATGAPVAERLAQRALVLPHPAPTGPAEPAPLLGTGSDEPSSLTLVAVPREQVPRLAGASAWAGITAVVVE